MNFNISCIFMQMDDFHSLVDAFKDELTGAGTGINKALLEMIKKLKV